MELTHELRENAGLQWVLERLSPLSPFGKQAARTPRWYGPGEEAALEEELEQYAREGNAHAFGNVNDTFHHKLYSYCGNRVLIEMIDDLLERSALFRRSSWNSSARNTQRVIQGHRAMLEAVAARDAEAAQAAAEAHIRLFLSQSLNAVD